MKGKRTRVSLKVIFQSLKDLLLSEVEGYNEFVTEISQEDTFYLVRKVESNETSYFASIQIRSKAVYFQLHTNMPFLSGVPFLAECPAVKIEPDTRSLLFTRSIKGCEATLRDLIKKTLQE